MFSWQERHQIALNRFFHLLDHALDCLEVCVVEPRLVEQFFKILRLIQVVCGVVVQVFVKVVGDDGHVRLQVVTGSMRVVPVVVVEVLALSVTLIVAKSFVAVPVVGVTGSILSIIARSLPAVVRRRLVAIGAIDMLADFNIDNGLSVRRRLEFI